jgi:spore coat polysaccharide biosynthesis protein SpsF
MHIGAIIQARMQSSRLPGKILLPLPLNSEVSLVEHVIHSILRTECIDTCVLAATTNKADDDLEQVAQKCNITLYRGSEKDVLSRFVELTALYEFDVIVRVTADNPFLDSAKLNEIIKRLIDNNLDYIYTSGLPLGMNFEVLSKKAIIESGMNVEDAFSKEHVTTFVRESGEYKVEHFIFENILISSNLRMSIDYPSDFSMASLLFSLLPDLKFLGIENLYEINIKYPWIFDVNKDNFQKRKYISIQDELQDAIKVLDQSELLNASQILKKRLND